MLLHANAAKHFAFAVCLTVAACICCYCNNSCCCLFATACCYCNNSCGTLMLHVQCCFFKLPLYHLLRQHHGHLPIVFMLISCVPVHVSDDARWLHKAMRRLMPACCHKVSMCCRVTSAAAFQFHNNVLLLASIL